MESLNALKQMEGRLGTLADKTQTLKAKLDDLVFRAQRISNAMKNKTPNNDTMFGYDLQHFRREARAMSGDIESLPATFNAIEKQSSYNEQGIKFAQTAMRGCTRLAQALKALHDAALLAHQHIRASDHKMEAWYIAQEIEEMAQKGQGLPAASNKIVIIISTPPDGGATPPAGGATPPAGGATPPAAPPAA